MGIQLLSGTNNKAKQLGTSAYRGVPITETITNGFFTVDERWTVKYWNRAAEQLLNVKAKDILEKNFWEVFAAIIPLDFYAVYQKAFIRDVPMHFNEYWVEMNAWYDVITYYNDDVLSVSFKSSNHPQPLHPNLQLKALNELYRFVTEVTNDCLWELNIENRELFWIDGGHKRTFGYEIVNALIPQSFWESRLHAEDKDRVLTGLNSVISTGAATFWEEDYRFKKADGNYAYVHDRAHIIYEENKPARMIGATQDITGRKLTEIKLFESERKLSLIARQTVNAVIITDVEEKIIWVNEAFTRITEYLPKEALGKNPEELLQGNDTDPLTVDYLRAQILQQLPFDCDILNYSKSGRRYWVHVQGQALLDESGKCERYFAMQTDITEKVLLKEKLRLEQLTKQTEITNAVLTAQENERYEIGKELHDNVNQILGAAKLYIEMAKTGEPGNDIYLDQACEHLLSVIEEIRSISKSLIPQSMNVVGLNQSIEILIADLSRIHPVKITFSERHIDTREIDEKLQLNIFRVVQEQTNNILKHSAATAATIDLKRVGTSIVLTISDNGKGTDTTGRTTGVGMRNIQSRAEIYHGSMSVISKPGAGYELKVTFLL